MVNTSSVLNVIKWGKRSINKIYNNKCNTTTFNNCLNQISNLSINENKFCCISVITREFNNSDREKIKSLKKAMLNYLPFFACGEIVRGFGRGSKELGIPTANYPLEVVKSLPDGLQTGVYYGWANVDDGEVYQMVMSVGWNPFFDNREKSMETHILHNFDRDLYGHILKVCMVGYLRPENNFDSLDALITAIKNDISQAKELLDSNEESRRLKDSEYFKESCQSNCRYSPQQ